MSDHFLKKLSAVFATRQPSVSHPCKEWQDNEKKLYATILAATITADRKVEKQQAILFGLLLKAMGLKNKQRECFILAENLTPEEIKGFCQLLESKQQNLHFLADITMLFRVDNPLTEEQITILNSWVSLLNMTSHDVKDVIFVINKCLKINHEQLDRDNRNNDSLYFQRYFSYWAEQMKIFGDDESSKNNKNEQSGIHDVNNEQSINSIYYGILKPFFGKIEQTQTFLNNKLDNKDE